MHESVARSTDDDCFEARNIHVEVSRMRPPTNIRRSRRSHVETSCARLRTEMERDAMSVDDMIEVLVAFRDGRPIQYRWGANRIKAYTPNPWRDTTAPMFDFTACDYRVKPLQESSQSNSGAFPG